MHFAAILLQEITAEGLRGMTLNNLWLHLASESSGFPLLIDDHTKQFIWRILISMKSLSFHANPTVHEYLMPYDRRTWLVTTDSGMFYDIPPDFPPLKFHPTSDPMEPGSSMFYSTRVDVTEQIRSNSHLHLLENVVSQWGDCLVMVASRQERHNFVLGNICNASELSATCYMMLEEIVRHRYNGLPTTNFDGLGHCGLTPSTIWYARQKLEKLGLLISQPYMSKYKTHTMSTGVLLHHWRFHRHFPFPNAVMLQKLVDLLHESPTKSHTLNYLRHAFGLTQKGIKRVMIFAQREGFVSISKHQFSECCSYMLRKPCSELTESDYQEFAKVNSLQRTSATIPILLVELKDTAMDIETWLSSLTRSKLKPHTGRSAGSGCNSENSDEEEGEEAEAEFESSQLAGEEVSTVAPSPSSYPAGSSNVNGEGNLSLLETSPSDASKAATTTTEMKQAQCAAVPEFLSFAVFRRLAVAPLLNPDDSISVQLARLLLPREINFSGLLKITHLDYFCCRRFLTLFRHMDLVRSIKRSSQTTFLIYRQFMTESERAEMFRPAKKEKGVTKEVSAFNVRTQREARREFILKYLDEHRVVRSTNCLCHVIWNHEASIGLKTRMDHKSLDRIIDELIQSKLVIIRFTKTVRGNIRLLCHPSVTEDDPLLIAASRSVDLTLRKKKLTFDHGRTVDRILFQREQVRLSDLAMQKSKWKLEICARLRRRLLLHEYLFYVVYALPENVEPIRPAMDNLPAVYRCDYSWRRFVAPAHPPETMSRGWFSVNELLRSMPFGLFLYLSGVSSLPKIMCRWLGLNSLLPDLTTEQLEHLDAQLTIDREQDVPVNELLLLPLNTVQAPGGPFGRLARWLLSVQRLRVLHLLLEELTMHNLISMFESQTGSDPNEGSKVIAFLHRNASLLDTRYASPGYRVLTDLGSSYIIRYHFSTEADVSSYWQTCEFISKNTPLGYRSLKTDLDTFDLPSTQKKPVTYKDEPPEVVDDGTIPHLQWPETFLSESVTNQEGFVPCGACGFHPMDFTYFSRNWDRKPDGAGGDHGCSSEDSVEEVPTKRPSRSTTTLNTKSKDGVPLLPELSIWQWPQKLFEDVEFQAGFELLPPLSHGARNSLPSENNKTSWRKHGLRCALKLLQNRRPNGLTSSVPESNMSVNPSSPTLHDSTFATTAPDSTVHQSKKLTGASTRPIRPPRKLRPAPKPALKKRRKPRWSIRTTFAGRAHRCSWSTIEDQLLVVCRVASILIGGPRQREFLCVPYLVARDILHRYMSQSTPLKTPPACARRLKYILFLRRTHSAACRILWTRVSNCSELQSKYNFGWKKWHLFIRDQWNEASHLFCELVDRIISEFVPRLNRIRLALIQQGRPPFEGHATPVKDQQEATEAVGVTTPFPDPIQAPVAIHPYETRAELEKRFTFFTLNDKPESSSHLHDVGKSRVAVVVHALYNYVLASFRAVKESGLPFLGATFHRVLRQYPRQQLSQALSLLLSNQMVNRVKFSMPEEEYRIFNAKKLKLSSRFKVWCYHEFHVKERHIMDAQQLHNKYLTISSSIAADYTDQAPLMIHNFADHTTGGAVAFFLDMMLSPQNVDLKMYFHLTDITFIPDEAIQQVIDQYYSNSSTLELPDAGEIAQQVKKNAPKGLLNRSLLKRLCQAPACFADPNFWSISGFDRRFRWFDHHLSFSGGELHLYATSTSVNSKRTVDHQEDFVTCDDVVRQQRIDSVVNAVMNNLLPTLDPKPDLDLSTVGEHTDLLRCLEKFIIEGRFTGRTVEEIKATLGDTEELAHVFNVLLNTKTVFWLGSTVSRFVHLRYVRLWVIHLKSNRTVTSKSITTNHVDDMPIEPAEKRSRMFPESTEVAEPTPPPPIPPSSPDRPVDIKGNLDPVEQTFEEELALKHEIEDLGYFFPECWYAEDGRPKPRYFCGFLQGLISRLTDSSGVTLSHFAMEHQWLFGPQAVRRLVFFLRDMGALRLCRVVRHTKPGLFSARPTYTVSDEPILASPEELTLIPTPHCLSVVGAFCEQFLARTETSTKTPYNATTSATSDVQDNQTD